MPRAPALFTIAAGLCAGLVFFVPAAANQVIVSARMKAWPDEVLKAMIIGRWVADPGAQGGDPRTVEQFNPDGTGTAIFYADIACTRIEKTVSFRWQLSKSVLSFERPASARSDDERWIIGPMTMAANMSAQPGTPWYFWAGDDFYQPLHAAMVTRIKAPSCNPAEVEEQRKEDLLERKMVISDLSAYFPFDTSRWPREG